MNKTILLIIPLVGFSLLAFQNCAPMMSKTLDQQDSGSSTGNTNSNGEASNDSDNQPLLNCSERQVESRLTTRLPGAFGQGDRVREVGIRLLNRIIDGEYLEVKINECDVPFDGSGIVSWNQGEQEATIDIVFNNELNEMVFDEDGIPLPGPDATFNYSYNVMVYWYEDCDSTETAATAQSASQQFAWDIDETILDENGCEVDIRQENVDFFVPQSL